MLDGDGASLGIAVSGGPDSLALLLLAHAAFPGVVEAATVDHQLRRESAAEAQFVATVCADLGVQHKILPVKVEAGNLQQEAREARYQALSKWMARRRLTALATAHHADDQTETLLVRLNRGSGLSGLAGIRSTTSAPGGARLVRPLLQWRRSELDAIVSAAGIDAVADPSNADPRYDRARMRLSLADADWIDPMGFAKSAALLEQAERALDQVIENEFWDCCEGGDPYAYFPYLRGDYGREPIWIGIVAYMAQQFAVRLDRGDAAKLVEALRRGDRANVCGVQAWCEDRGGRTAWLITRESPRRTG